MPGDRNVNKSKGYYTDSDGIAWSECPECGNVQGDMGNHVSCEECGYGPMPTEPRKKGGPSE